MKNVLISCVLVVLGGLGLSSPPLRAQVPQLVNYQGRVAVGTVNFNGSGLFKFALVNSDGSTTFWSNDGSSTAGSEPAVAVTLTVTNGLYSTLLGDTSLPNMTAIPASVWSNPDVRLRVWFDDQMNGSQLLAPDQRLAPTGYLADGAVGSTQLAAGSVGSLQLAPNLTLTGNLTLPVTTASSGVIYAGSDTLLHDFGVQNIFVGEQAGNLTMTGQDNTALGYRSLALNTSGMGNTALGFTALHANDGGAYNTAVGYEALELNTSGFSNTATGAGALVANTVGYQNTADADDALAANVSGNNNTAEGYAALFQNQSGSNNTATGVGALYSDTANNNSAAGYCALYSNTSGQDNVAHGYSALYSNTSGPANTAVGYEALYTNTVGFGSTAVGFQALYNSNFPDAAEDSNNTAVGIQSLYSATTGTNNTAIGSYALYSLATGSNNIAIGALAGTLITGTNNIVIGASGDPTGDNMITIGSYQTSAFMAGIYGSTVSGASPVYVLSNGHLGTVTSSRRFKRDIASMDAASEALLSMRPVTFKYKSELDPQGLPQFGLIAEEVAALNPDLVTRDAQGEIYTVRYEAVNAMLLNEFLKDHRRAQQKEAEIQNLEDKNAALEKRLAELETQDQEREARLWKLERLLCPAAEVSASTASPP